MVFPYCAGLDVHKQQVTACRVHPDPSGQEPDGIMEVREFGTLTIALLALADWLAEGGVTHVAIESTGEYGKPVYNLLEGLNLESLLRGAVETENGVTSGYTLLSVCQRGTR